MKKLIIDCDNTFGITGCDIDDGLAIIYAFGSGKCQILGITTTFGNSGLHAVYPNTVKFMQAIGKAHIPVFKGSENHRENNEAAVFLVDMVNKYPGEIDILATGSLTNLYHAYRLDNSFYDKINEISLMGGITEPLMIGGKMLNELNFSCNYEASCHVLQNGKSIKIATGNNCLDAFFLKDRFDRLNRSNNSFPRWLYEEAQYWFKREKDVFSHDGIYKWDVYAAAMLLCPEFFEDSITGITPDLDSLKTGLLMGRGEIKSVNLPKIKKPDDYMQHVYDVYENFK